VLGPRATSRARGTSRLFNDGSWRLHFDRRRRLNGHGTLSLGQLGSSSCRLFS
jgi:hypothetical protein